MARVPLREVAFTRCGDKDDAAIICVIPYDEADWDLVREQVTVARIEELFAPELHGDVERYEFPNLKILNFVLNGILGGGTSRSLAQDTQGKVWASLLLLLEIDR